MNKLAKFLLKTVIVLLILAGVLGISIIGGKELFKSWISEDELVRMTEGKKSETAKNNEKDNNEEKNKIIKKLKISAVGDCTIGWDTNHDPEKRFDAYLEKNDGNYGYYLEKVKDMFNEDDLTIANLEGTFTEYDQKVEKEYNFSAPDAYKNVLTEGNIDIVSFANNHTHDFGEIGYEDTIKTLDSIEMPYYGYDKYLVKEVNGIKIGFFGLLDIDCKKYEEIDKVLDNLKKENCDLIIASMHWGIEGDYKQNVAQERMGHYLIDNGVDLVLGSHPHRYQGIEKYNGHYIVYSLGNFCFGGNINPKDKDTFIFQQTFTFEDNELKLDDNINIVPASISGVNSTNNYQPIVLDGARGKNILNKILRFSKGFIYTK